MDRNNFKKTKNDAKTDEEFAQNNLEATSDKTYDDDINAAEANWLDANYAQQALAFVTFDLNVDTDYSQFLADNASNTESWWTTIGRNIFTTCQSNVATSFHDETLAINLLEKDRDLANNLTHQTRTAMQHLTRHDTLVA